MSGYTTAQEIELVISRFFNPRVNLVVPNVSWGLNLHECDLLVVTGSRYAYEVEIKTSKQDMIKDKQKRHGHNSNLIKKIYFAIPSKLCKHIEHIPLRAGVIAVNSRGRCFLIKDPQTNKRARKLTDQEYSQFLRLGVLRIFPLKQTIMNLRNNLKELRQEKMNERVS